LEYHVIAKDLWKCNVGKKVNRLDKRKDEEGILFH